MKLTGRQVRVWLGEDSLDDISEYISEILNVIYNENKSEIGKELLEEIIEYNETLEENHL